MFIARIVRFTSNKQSDKRTALHSLLSDIGTEWQEISRSNSCDRGIESTFKG